MTLIKLCLILTICSSSCLHCLAAETSDSATDAIDFAKPFTVPRSDLGAALNGNAVIYSNATGVLKSEQPEDPVERQKRNDADAHSVAVATVWVAVFTVVLACAAVIQMGMFILQLGLTRQAANDARTAALAAKASAEAIPLIERAYLFVKITFEPPLIERFVQEGFGASHTVSTYVGTIAVSIFNHGKTPAVLRRLRAYEIYEQSRPVALIEHENVNNKIPDGLVVAPSESHVYKIRLSYDKERFTQLHDVVWRIYCLGLVDYDDVLGKHQTTGFCWQSFSQNNQLDFVISPSAEFNYRT
jgi:hypothetical protein